MQQSIELETIDPEFLDDVSAGAIPWRKLGRYALRGLPVVNAIAGIYDGYEGYEDWRNRGHNVPESVFKGVVEWAKTATFYDLWGSTPAY